MGLSVEWLLETSPGFSEFSLCHSHRDFSPTDNTFASRTIFLLSFVFQHPLEPSVKNQNKERFNLLIGPIWEADSQLSILGSFLTAFGAYICCSNV